MAELTERISTLSNERLPGLSDRPRRLKIVSRKRFPRFVRPLFGFLFFWGLITLALLPGVIQHYFLNRLRNLWFLVQSPHKHLANSRNFVPWTSLGQVRARGTSLGRPHGPIPLPSRIFLSQVLADLGQTTDSVTELQEKDDCFPTTQQIICSVGPENWTLRQKCLASSGTGFDEENPEKRDSTNQNKSILRIFMIRIVGNDLPPIQGLSQTSRNLKHIMAHEMVPSHAKIQQDGWEINWDKYSNNSDGFDVVSSPKRCELGSGVGSGVVEKSNNSQNGSGPQNVVVRRFTTVNRLMEWNSYHDLLQIVDEKRTLTEPEVPPLKASKTSDLKSAVTPKWRFAEPLLEVPFHLNLLEQAVNPPTYVSNQNRARNWSVQESIALGADWVFPFDGNVFVTKEGFQGIIAGAVAAERAKKEFIFVPFYRVKKNENEEHGETYHVDASSTVKELLPVISSNEAQLGFRAGVGKLFDEDLGYGRRNKYEMIRFIQKNSSSSHCSEADVGFDKPTLKAAFETALVARCGYTLRLSYWPDYERSPAALSIPLTRQTLREKSIFVFDRRVADAMGRGFTTEYMGWVVVQFVLCAVLVGATGFVVTFLLEPTERVRYITLSAAQGTNIEGNQEEENLGNVTNRGRID